jgi:hypothetical protein
MYKLQKTAKSAQKFIDFRIGIAGAIVMGGIVLGINYFSTHEMLGSITAAIKQGAYTFIFGGTLMRACEYLATNIKKRGTAIMASIVIPSVFTLFLTFGMHNLKGTPKPIESTIPTLIIIPATAVWGIRKRKQMDLKLQ